MQDLGRNLGQPCPRGASPEAGPEAGTGFRSPELSPRSRLRLQKQAPGPEAGPGSEAGPEAGSRCRLTVQKQAQGFGPSKLHSGPEAGSRLRVLDCPEAGSGFRSKPRSTEAGSNSQVQKARTQPRSTTEIWVRSSPEAPRDFQKLIIPDQKLFHS